MNEALGKDEFYTEMKELREFIDKKIEPVAKLSMDNSKAIAVLQSEQKHLAEDVSAIEEVKKQNKTWDIINTALIFFGTLLGVNYGNR